MFKTETIIKSISAEDYILQYSDCDRFIGYCKECSNYGTVWVCPPYRFNALDRIKRYRYVHIIGTKVYIDEETRHRPTNAEEQKEISYYIMENTRKGLDGKLLDFEKQYPDSLAFFAGCCYLCRKEDCTRRIGKECLFPEKARSSMEAYGLDISRTASELLGIEMIWSKDLVLPEYFTLVSGLFTNHVIEIPEW